MRTIIIKWVPEKTFGGKSMVVVESTHGQYANGTKFSARDFHSATDDGYTIVSLPVEEE